MYQSTGFISKVLPLTLSILCLAFVSCDKDDDDDDEKVEYTLNASVDGHQEVPMVETDATGTLTGTYNKNSNLLTYSVSWQQLSGPVTGMHFHGPADIGEPANVAVPITGFPAAEQGTYSGSATLTEAQEAELLGEKWYVNIHTDLNKPGEIRGQVMVD